MEVRPSHGRNQGPAWGTKVAGELQRCSRQRLGGVVVGQKWGGAGDESGVVLPVKHRSSWREWQEVDWSQACSSRGVPKSLHRS